MSFWDLPSLYPLLKIVFQKKSLITGFTVTVAIRQNYKKKKKQRKLALSRNAGKISYILRTYHFIMLEKKTHFDKVWIWISVLEVEFSEGKDLRNCFWMILMIAFSYSIEYPPPYT